MAIGAHCDDIDLRCGGTFSRLVREGKEGCYVVGVENAYVGKHFFVEDSFKALEIRRQESLTASKIIGAKKVEWLQFKSFYFSKPDPGSEIFPSFDSLESIQEDLKNAIFNGLPPVANADKFAQCRDKLIQLINDFSPQIIFTHSPDDRHPDHYSLARFVEFIVRKINIDGKNIEIYFWEPGSNGPIVGFVPNCFVELADADVERKQKAIECYKSQYPPGLLDNFAARRAKNYGKIAGIKYAEAYNKGLCLPKGAWKGAPEFLKKLKDTSREKMIYGMGESFKVQSSLRLSSKVFSKMKYIIKKNKSRAIFYK